LRFIEKAGSRFYPLDDESRGIQKVYEAKLAKMCRDGAGQAKAASDDEDLRKPDPPSPRQGTYAHEKPVQREGGQISWGTYDWTQTKGQDPVEDIHRGSSNITKTTRETLVSKISLPIHRSPLGRRKLQQRRTRSAGSPAEHRSSSDTRPRSLVDSSMGPEVSASI